MKNFVPRMALAAVLALACLPSLSFAQDKQTLEEKIKDVHEMKLVITKIMESQIQHAQQLNGVMSVQARLQSDLTDARAEIAELKEMVKALTAAQGVGLAVTSTTWDGQRIYTAQRPTQTGQVSAGYGASYGAGDCSSGSCNVGGRRGRR